MAIDPFEEDRRRRRRQDDLERTNKTIRDTIERNRKNFENMVRSTSRRPRNAGDIQGGPYISGPALTLGCLGVIALIAFAVWQVIT